MAAATLKEWIQRQPVIGAASLDEAFVGLQAQLARAGFPAQEWEVLYRILPGQLAIPGPLAVRPLYAEPEGLPHVLLLHPSSQAEAAAAARTVICAAVGDHGVPAGNVLLVPVDVGPPPDPGADPLPPVATRLDQLPSVIPGVLERVNQALGTDLSLDDPWAALRRIDALLLDQHRQSSPSSPPSSSQMRLISALSLVAGEAARRAAGEGCRWGPCYGPVDLEGRLAFEVGPDGRPKRGGATLGENRYPPVLDLDGLAVFAPEYAIQRVLLGEKVSVEQHLRNVQAKAQDRAIEAILRGQEQEEAKKRLRSARRNAIATMIVILGSAVLGVAYLLRWC